MKWCNCGVVSHAKRKISIYHRHYFAFSKILPWQMKSTFVMSKYFLNRIILNFAHMRSKSSSASRTPAAHPPGGVYGSGTFPAAVRRHHP